MRFSLAPSSARHLPLVCLIAWQALVLSTSTAAQESKDTSAASIPASGSVALKDAFREHFTVGTAVSRAITTGRGFRRDEAAVRQDIVLVKRHFGQIVAENDMKWQLIHPRPGAEGYDFGPADAFVAFGEANQMSLAGHTLVWHSQTPDWVFAGTHRPPADEKPGPPAPRSPGPPPFDLSGPRASRDELLARMRDHIQTVMGRYRGKIKVWDVVNEAVSDGGPDILRRSPWSVIVGPDFVEKAFEYAHEADPTAILRYNDYGLENREKRRKAIQLVRSLQERKIPIHAIGSQAHCNVSITFEQMDEALTDLETLGLPIHITELDVNSATGGQGNVGADVGGNAAATAGGVVSEADQRLAKTYESLFRAFVKHRQSIEMVTFWGPNDANSWRSRGRPLLFDGDNRAKPAFDAVIRVAAGVDSPQAPAPLPPAPVLRLQGAATDPATIDYAKLPQLAGQHAVVCEPTEDLKFQLHNYLIHHDGKYWCMFSHGSEVEDLPTQFVSYATSDDGLTWSKSQPLTPRPAAPYAYIARGFWLRDGELLALVAHYRDKGAFGVNKELKLEAYAWNPTTQSWTFKTVLFADAINNFAPQKLHSGEWLMTRRDARFNVYMLAGGVKSLDDWQSFPVVRRNETPPFSPDEPFWWQLDDGRLHGLFRDNGGSQRLYQAFSSDSGRTWTRPAITNFPNATSKCYSLKLSSGQRVLISNANPKWGRRELYLSTSQDGVTFTQMARLVIPSPKATTFQYPHAIEQDGHLLIAFSQKKMRTEVLKVPLANIEALGR